MNSYMMYKQIIMSHRIIYIIYEFIYDHIGTTPHLVMSYMIHSFITIDYVIYEFIYDSYVIGHVKYDFI